MGTRVQIVFDCHDPAAMTEFWATALGYVEQPPPEGYDRWEDLLTEIGVPESEWNSRGAVVDPDGIGPRLFFQQVPEAKTVKNRVHLDITAPRGSNHESALSAEVERLKLVGAKVFRDVQEYGQHWIVMQDPEGNEFCVQ